ncbi:hypothetical protein HY251_14105, partial [bacterium]|nr:hypothetical protein [bacterium]
GAGARVELALPPGAQGALEGTLERRSDEGDFVTIHAHGEGIHASRAYPFGTPGGKFRLALPPGRYRVTADGMDGCDEKAAAVEVEVRSSETTRIAGLKVPRAP